MVKNVSAEMSGPAWSLSRARPHGAVRIPGDAVAVDNQPRGPSTPLVRCADDNFAHYDRAEIGRDIALLRSRFQLYADRVSTVSPFSTKACSQPKTLIQPRVCPSATSRLPANPSW